MIGEPRRLLVILAIVVLLAAALIPIAGGSDTVLVLGLHLAPAMVLLTVMRERHEPARVISISASPLLLRAPPSF